MKKKRIKIKHIYEPIFHENFYYIDCKTHAEYRTVAKRKLNFEPDIKNNTSGGCQTITNNKVGVEIEIFWHQKINQIF